MISFSAPRPVTRGRGFLGVVYRERLNLVQFLICLSFEQPVVVIKIFQLSRQIACRQNLDLALANGGSVRPSVCPSHPCGTPKWLKVSKHFLHRTTERCFQFLVARFYNHNVI